MSSDAPKRRLPRFSLRSLILFVLLAGSGYGLWVKWEPWAVSRVLQGHKKSVRSIAISGDGRFVITGGRDNDARVWDLTSGKSPLVLRGHKGDVDNVGFSPDGNLCVTSSRDWAGKGKASMRVWDPRTGTCHLALQDIRQVIRAKLLPDGEHVLACESRSVQIWHVDSKDLKARFDSKTGRTSATGLSSDGKRLAIADEETIYVWEWEVSRRLAVLKGHRARDMIFKLVFSPDGSHLASSGDDKTVRVWNIETGRCQHVLRPGISVLEKDVAYSPDGRRLLTVGTGGAVQIWDADTGTLAMKLATRGDPITRAWFSSDDSRIYTLLFMGDLRMWDARSGAPIASVEGKFARASVADDGSTIVTMGLYEDRALVWVRRRPEYWWGVAWLPEFWLTVALGVGLIVSVWQDPRAFRPAT